MRFILTSDVHWGMRPEPEHLFGKDRANDIKSSFRSIVERAGELSADCLLIAGDLFHRQPLTRDLKELNLLFSSVPSVQVILISGGRDRVEKHSPLLSFHWAPNVHWLMERQPRVYFDALNTEFTGFFPEKSGEVRASGAASGGSEAEEAGGAEGTEETENTGTPLRILLMHSGDGRDIPKESALKELPFDFLALGGHHNPLELCDRYAIFPGTPEPLSSAEAGQHGIYVGDIDPMTRRLQRLDFHPIARASYIPLQVSIRKETTERELLRLLREEMRRRGENNLYRIRISGRHAEELRFDLSPLSGEFRITEILDESLPDYDFSALFREHPSDMIGFYIRTLLRRRTEEMSPVELHALYYGIRALLNTGKEDIR